MEEMNVGQKLSEISKSRSWKWKDDRSGKTKKKGGEGKRINMNMKESMKKHFREK